MDLPTSECINCARVLPFNSSFFVRSTKTTSGLIRRCRDCDVERHRERNKTAAKRIDAWESGTGGDFLPKLYRLYNAAHEIIYVGVTMTPIQRRFKEHSKSKSWWSEVQYATIEYFDDKIAALRVERELCWQNCPAYNKATTARSVPTWREVPVYLHDQERIFADNNAE